MTRHIVLCFTFVLGFAAAVPSYAQVRPEPWTAKQAAPRLAPVAAMRTVDLAEPGTISRPAAPVAAVAAGAAAGWFVGAAAGAAVGYVIQPEPESEYAGLSNAGWIGLLAGMALGPPVGAHLVNRAQGDLLVSSAGSVAAMGAGIFVTRTAVVVGARDPVQYLLLAPLLQVAVVTLVERATTR